VGSRARAVFARTCLVEVDVGYFERRVSAREHGGAPVGDERHQELFELASGEVHSRVGGADEHREGDGGAEHGAERSFERLHDASGRGIRPGVRAGLADATRQCGGQAAQVGFERPSIGGCQGELLDRLGARGLGRRRDPLEGQSFGVILLAKGVMPRDGFVAFRLGGAQVLLEPRDRPSQLVCFGLVARDEFVLARLRLQQRRLEGPLGCLQDLGGAGVLGRGVCKRVAPCLVVAVTLGEQRLLPNLGLVNRDLRLGRSRELLGQRPLELLLRRLEVGGEPGLVGGVLLGDGMAPLLGLLERGFECREPGLVAGRRRNRAFARRQGRGQPFPPAASAPACCSPCAAASVRARSSRRCPVTSQKVHKADASESLTLRSETAWICSV
jgi:hypothetical protein